MVVLRLVHAHLCLLILQTSDVICLTSVRSAKVVRPVANDADESSLPLSMFKEEINCEA